MKTFAKIILIILGVLLLAAIGFFVFVNLAFAGALDFPVTEITREASPDGKYEVIIEQMGEAAWPFGPATARITVKNTETGKKIERVKYEVANDGTGLYESQFSFEWSEDELTITIDPAEAKNIEHTVKLK